MRKKRKRLSKKEFQALSREEKLKYIKERTTRQPTPYDWLYVCTGTEDDILTFLVRTLMVPSAIILTVYYVFGYEINQPLIYFLFIGGNTFWWIKKARKCKELMKRGEWPPKKEEEKELTPEDIERIKKKIEELGD